jgi:hypothetical protein
VTSHALSMRKRKFSQFYLNSEKLVVFFIFWIARSAISKSFLGPERFIVLSSMTIESAQRFAQFSEISS